MRYFLTSLLSVIIFCAHSQVTIPDHVARWYMERADVAKLSEKRLIRKDSIITNLSEQNRVKDFIISKYKKDSVVYDSILTLKDAQIKIKESQVEIYAKISRKQSLKADIATGAGTGAIAGSLLGQPLIGTAIGAGVGFIHNKLKRKAR